MNWSEERWVRVYCRDTAEWCRWSDEARAVFLLMLRAADRSGTIECSDEEDLAVMLRLRSVAWVSKAMPELCEQRGDVPPPVMRGAGGFVIRNYAEAQEAVMSDAYRSRESRARQRHKALRTDVTNENQASASRDVTQQHETSRNVTPFRSDPFRSVPSVPIRSVSPSGGEIADATRPEDFSLTPPTASKPAKPKRRKTAQADGSKPPAVTPDGAAITNAMITEVIAHHAQATGLHQALTPRNAEWWQVRDRLKEAGRSRCLQAIDLVAASQQRRRQSRLSVTSIFGTSSLLADAESLALGRPASAPQLGRDFKREAEDAAAARWLEGEGVAPPEEINAEVVE